MLKLNTSSERAPNGIFSVPDRPQDLMTKIEQTYSLWYKLFSEEMIPLIADRRKWHFDEQDLVVNDIVFFKLYNDEETTEDGMSDLFNDVSDPSFSRLFFGLDPTATDASNDAILPVSLV